MTFGIKSSSKPKREKDSLLTRIDTFLEKRVNKPLPYVQKPGHKLSSLGTDCLRKIYYAYYRVERDKPIDVFLARIFDTGNFYEAMVMSWLIEMKEHITYRNKGDGQIPKSRDGKSENRQFPITIADWRIPKGYIDNVAIVDGDLWLYEIKSKNGDKFDALTGPDYEHVVQVACYYKAFNDHLENGDFAHIPELRGVKEVKGVKFIYVNKNTSNLRVYALEVEDLVDEIINISSKLDSAHVYTDTVALPPMTKGNCTYCDFKAKCKKDWNDVKVIS